MPIFALALALLLPLPAAAQGLESWSHAAMVGDATARVDVAWQTRGARRTARVTARLEGGPELVIHDGPTVRTAIGASGDHLAAVTYHGGDTGTFVRAHLIHRDGSRLVLDRTVEIPRDAATADGRLRFPAAALVAATPRGFAIMVQHQERDPTADVVTTLSVLDASGAELEATRVVAVPWALAALAHVETGYELAVWFGGFGGTGTGSVRVCVVHLDAAGSPTEHPWWASPEIDPSDVYLVVTRGAVVAAWLDAESRVMSTRWPSRGGWSVEPPAPTTLGRVPADARAWALTLRAGEPAVISAR